LRQVLEQAGIRPDPRLFLSRCLICNVPVREVQREDVAGKVPEGVFQRSRTFHECPECGRIYWEGSHADRIKKRLEVLGEGFGEALLPRRASPNLTGFKALA
jgi:uncharacterized protein